MLSQNKQVNIVVRRCNSMIKSLIPMSTVYKVTSTNVMIMMIPEMLLAGVVAARCSNRCLAATIQAAKKKDPGNGNHAGSTGFQAKGEAAVKVCGCSPPTGFGIATTWGGGRSRIDLA